MQHAASGRFFTFSSIALLALTIGFSSCKKKDDQANRTQDTMVSMPSPSGPTISSVTLAKRVDANRDPVDATRDFGVRDTINAVIKTTDAPANALITANWYFTQTNQLVGSDSERLAQGNNTTRFQMVKASDWPTGDYKIDVAVNGGNSRSETFTVKK